MNNNRVKTPFQGNLANTSNSKSSNFPNNSKFLPSSPSTTRQSPTPFSETLDLKLLQNPFESPNYSQISFAESEGGNTSGQDEFHLERYSESTDRGQSNKFFIQPILERQSSKRNRDGSPRKRPRPGLNIITDFSNIADRSHEVGLKMDQIVAKRSQTGQKEFPTSKSHTVEHFQSETQQQNQQAGGFINLRDITGLRKKEKKENSAQKGKIKSESTSIVQNERGPSRARASTTLEPYHTKRLQSFSGNRGSSDKTGSAKDSDTSTGTDEPLRLRKDNISSSGRSIVIGISIPQNEIHSHQPLPETTSALSLITPFTPTILITSAGDETPWNSGRDGSSNSVSRRRPPSSVYSQTPALERALAKTEIPPIPPIHPAFGQPEATTKITPLRKSIESWDTNSVARRRAWSEGTLFDEDEVDDPPSPNRPSSAESKIAILRPSPANTRPDSTGWWNLLLSPMMSRAGTLMGKKINIDNTDVPPVPRFSAMSEKSDQVTVFDEKRASSIMSTQTTRRAGLESTRASTWSQWSSWEKDRDECAKQNTENIENHEREMGKTGHDTQYTSASVPFVLGRTSTAEGLAAEYFLACTVNESSSASCINCHNPYCKGEPVCLQRGMLKEQTSPKKIQAKLSEEKLIPNVPSPPNKYHTRAESDSTIIEDEPEVPPKPTKEIRFGISGKIEQNSKSQQLQSSKWDGNDTSFTQSTSSSQVAKAQKSIILPAYSPPRKLTKAPKFVAIPPPSQRHALASPGPISPEAQRGMVGNGAIPMSEVSRSRQATPAALFINSDTNYPESTTIQNPAPFSLADIERPIKVRERAEARRQNLEKEDAVSRKVGGLWRGRGCFPDKGCFGRGGPEGRKRRRWYIAITTGLLLIIITSVVLATQLTRKGDRTPVQSQWLNLTGFPPMPTGISTIAQPNVALANSACVQPSTLWSCAVPKEDQASIAPNDADEPNFRFEISFRNGTVTNGTNTVSNTGNSKRSTKAEQGNLQQRQDDPFTNALFNPVPAPPSFAEQAFLGNTTDNITAPFDGEETPFFITFEATSPVFPSTFNATKRSLQLLRRQSTNSSSGFTTGIPPPDIANDGTAASADLLPNDPLPYSQPIRLYNRGLTTEHYGFYNYFDRAIFLEGLSLFDSSATTNSEDGVPDDQIGGCAKAQASTRCTWSQTRFLVRIWTSPDFGGILVGSSAVGPNNPTTSNGLNNSATDFVRPGSFPYPVSISLDRHGGDISEKGIYCYGMNDQQQILVNNKTVVAEFRGFGGQLINPAPSVIELPDGSSSSSTGFDPTAGGIDGGTGGCACEWRNWAGNGIE